MALDPRLREWATDRQWEILQAVETHGSQRAAARAMGVHSAGIDRAVQAVNKKAALGGYAPEYGMTKLAAPGFAIKRVSGLYGLNQAGEMVLRNQWVIQSPSEQAFANAVMEAVAEFAEPIRLDAIPAGPTSPDNDIIPWINIGDAHLGMLAHEAETGENFDLAIAERELCAAIDILITEAGPHERCVIQDCGDFTHYENFAATTEASGHALDFDSRFPRMIKTYSRVMRYIIDRALQQFQHVDVIINQGNHSRTNDIWMAELLKVAYGPTGRVHVLNNDSVFIAYRMGNTFVLCHHSDKCKPKDLAHVMATDFHKDWGETTHRFIDIGHIHHAMVQKEHPGVWIESFNQLAPADKWAHDFGYRSRSCINMLFRSRTYGNKGRRVLSVEEVRDRIRAAMPTGSYQPTPKLAFAV